MYGRYHGSGGGGNSIQYYGHWNGTLRLLSCQQTADRRTTGGDGAGRQRADGARAVANGALTPRGNPSRSRGNWLQHYLRLDRAGRARCSGGCFFWRYPVRARTGRLRRVNVRPARLARFVSRSIRARSEPGLGISERAALAKSDAACSRRRFAEFQPSSRLRCSDGIVGLSPASNLYKLLRAVGNNQSRPDQVLTLGNKPPSEATIHPAP